MYKDNARVYKRIVVLAKLNEKNYEVFPFSPYTSDFAATPELEAMVQWKAIGFQRWNHTSRRRLFLGLRQISLFGIGQRTGETMDGERSSEKT